MDDDADKDVDNTHDVLNMIRMMSRQYSNLAKLSVESSVRVVRRVVLVVRPTVSAVPVAHTA